MTDQEQWDGAVEAAEREYAALSREQKAAILTLVEAIQEDKRAIADLAAVAGAPALCASCGGRCCEKGRYHFTLVDLLVFLATDTVLFRPDFSGGRCPFLIQGACLMAPAFRPLICVTFHCDMVEERLDPVDLRRLYDLEASLRERYGHMDRLFSRRLGFGLLLGYARYLENQDAGLLRRRVSDN